MKAVSLVTLLLISFSAFAAEPKIGYVDLQKAIESTKAGKKAKTALEKEFKAKQTEFQKKEEALKKMAQDIQKKAVALSEDAKRKKQAEFQQEMLKFRQEVAKSQQSIQVREREMTRPILKKMGEIIEKIAKKEKFTMILEKREQNIIWASEEVDVTPMLISRFEKEYK